MALLQKGYLGATPLFRQINWYEGGSAAIVNTSSSVTVTANASAHTMGSWSPIIASTSGDVSFLLVWVTAVAIAGDSATLLTLGTGSATNEVAFASNIAVGSATTSGGLLGNLIPIPVKIASGTRIAAQIQSVVTGGKTASVQIFAFNAGDYATTPTTVDVLGTDPLTSKGKEFTGAAGQWVVGETSTSKAYRAVALVLSGHDAAMGNITNAVYEVGVGASGSEVAFGWTRHNFTADERSGIAVPFLSLFGRNIPAGSRLSVRHNISANPERYGFTLIGIP
jgi:hypothetical protein